MCNVCDLYAPGHPSSLPALRALGNLTSGPIEWLEYLMPSCPTLPTPSNIPPLIISTLTKSLSSGSSGHHAVLKEGLGVVANLIGGTEGHRDIVISCPHLMELVILFLLSGQFDLQREAIFTVVNAYKNNQFLQHLSTNREILVRLIELLNAPDPEVVICSMNILRAVALGTGANELCIELGMMDVLDEIQYRSGNEDVRRLASTLTDEIFAEDEEEIAASGSGNGFGLFDSDQSGKSNSDGTPAILRGNKDAVKPAWMTATAAATNNKSSNVFTF